MKTSSRVAMIASGALLFMMTGGVAAWADADTSPVVEPGAVEPGATFTVSNDGCLGTLDEAGESEEPGLVTITFNDDAYAVDAEADGSWTQTLTAPEEPGEYDLYASCDGYGDGFDYPSTSVEVLAVEEDPPGEEPAVVTGAITDITRKGCEVTITTEVSAPGEYRLEVWDDGEEIDRVEWTMSDAGTYPAIWTITAPAREGAPGVGFGLYGEGAFPLDSVDPWEYPAEVADACYEATLPAGSVGSPEVPASLDALAETGADSSSSLIGLGIAGLLAGAGVTLVLIRRGRLSHIS